MLSGTEGDVHRVVPLGAFFAFCAFLLTTGTKYRTIAIER
jgi:hypothetical protein